MAILPDSALPLCSNPQHPAGMPRKMIYLQTKDYAHVFGCQACRDVNHKLSVRVMTDSFYRREVRKQLAAEGRLLTAPPPQRPVQLYGQTAQQSIGWDPAARRSKDGKFELVEYKELGNGDVRIQMAINGKLCPQMDDHIASREEFRSEEEYWIRVARGSELMLHLYGDPRAPLTPEESKQREQEMY
jgi:hypothetical protein